MVLRLHSTLCVVMIWNSVAAAVATRAGRRREKIVVGCIVLAVVVELEQCEGAKDGE